MIPMTFAGKAIISKVKVNGSSGKLASFSLVDKGTFPLLS